jgi:hypothetical protein
MSSADSPPRSGTRTLLIVLLILLVVLVLAVVACGGLAYLGIRAFGGLIGDFGSLVTAADSFLTNLQGNQLQAAYDQTSSGLQARMSRQEFEALVKKYPLLTTATSHTIGSFNINSTQGVSRGTIQVTVLGPTGSLGCTLVLVRENDVWKVDSLSVP